MRSSICSRFADGDGNGNGKKLTIMILDWAQEETDVPADNTHLWEESWDDDDTSEDFSAQLK